ncbi:MAG: MBL fold metallo-hydrolase [Burkholderiaceae bacterium]|nr:MBL fold metallo-hydrolase [Burkholderiaceae bacterium]
MALPFVHDLGDGIHVIDTGFHRDHFDAAYLVVQDGHALFVDCGTNFSVPRLLAALDDLGLPREAVDHVIPTHVHLDHAGGAGALMQQLPRATLLVHARGARHLIDPAALYAGALAVYGQAEMDRAYGQLVGVPAERVQATTDGQVLDWHGRRLEFIDTPGHARHHHCLWDEASRGWFTGDTFGLSYRETDTERGAWIMPTSTPVQFEPEALKRSITRLMARDPQAMYLTHYSRVQDLPRLSSLLFEQIDAMVALALPLKDHPQRHAALVAALEDLYRSQLQRHGVADVEAQLRGLALDIELNAQGLAVWLDKA